MALLHKHVLFEVHKHNLYNSIIKIKKVSCLCRKIRKVCLWTSNDLKSDIKKYKTAYLKKGMNQRKESHVKRNKSFKRIKCKKKWVNWKNHMRKEMNHFNSQTIKKKRKKIHAKNYHLKKSFWNKSYINKSHENLENVEIACKRKSSNYVRTRCK